ncbi:12835_t:CDS:1, partial [Gigaspora rosea]
MGCFLKSMQNKYYKQEKLYTEKTSCLFCRKNRRKCEKSDENSNQCRDCLERNIECVKYSPLKTEEYITKMTHKLKDHEGRISELELKVLKLENENLKIKS